MTAFSAIADSMHGHLVCLVATKKKLNAATARAAQGRDFERLPARPISIRLPRLLLRRWTLTAIPADMIRRCLEFTGASTAGRP